jgi:hypothetical protein
MVIRHPALSPSVAVKEYVAMHERLERSRDDYIVAEFAQVISDFGAVIEMVNGRYGSRFQTYGRTAENELSTRQLIEAMDLADSGRRIVDEMKVARPSTVRAARKAEAIERVWGTPGLDRAVEIYNHLRGGMD